jgi:hypothetical protein
MAPMRVQDGLGVGSMHSLSLRNGIAQKMITERLHMVLLAAVTEFAVWLFLKIIIIIILMRRPPSLPVHV